MKNRFDWFVNRDGFLDGALLATGLIFALLVFLRLVDVYL
jgi:hypothetical protein